MKDVQSRPQMVADIEEQLGWRPRPVAALLVRALQVILPFLAGWLAIRWLQGFFFSVDGRWTGLLVWLLQAIFVSVVVSAAVAQLVRRLTPLVSLLNMSLVFPDSTPSRFAMALRTGTVKRLLAQPTLQLSTSRQEAAEQAVQLVSYLAKHDPQTRGHTERVRAYADVIGQQMGLSAADLNGLRWGALLHDVGKLKVPANILNKPGKPTDQEWEILRRHPGAAVPILKPLEPWLGEWLLAAPQHHERWDGAGYPAGLRENEISLAGRIVAVADAYDVITSRRSYKEPMSAETAREELVGSAGSHFDPAVVRALLEAGVKSSGITRRLGWILELPSIVRALTVTGQAVAATVVAVAISSTSTIPASAELAAQQAPDNLGFIDAVEVEDEEQLPDASIGASAAIETPGGPQPASSQEPAATEPVAGPTSTTIVASGIDADPGTDSILSTTTVAPAQSVPSSPGGVSPSTTRAPATTTRAPAPTTTRAPAPTTTRAPAPTTTRAPAPTTTRAPAPTTTRAPAPTTTTTRAPAPTTTTSVPTTKPPFANTPDCQAVRNGETFLPGADLRNCDLSGLRAGGLQLNDALLDGANLSGAMLVNFNLDRASLDGVILTDARLTNGSAVDASFVGVSARRVDFFNVGFFRADFTNADLSSSNFLGASFGVAIARNANFSGSGFQSSNFNEADIRDANFSNVRTNQLGFERARLRGLNVAGADLSFSSFWLATGIPVGHSSATFKGTQCPDGAFSNTTCW